MSIHLPIRLAPIDENLAAGKCDPLPVNVSADERVIQHLRGTKLCADVVQQPVGHHGATIEWPVAHGVASAEHCERKIIVASVPV